MSSKAMSNTAHAGARPRGLKFRARRFEPDRLLRQLLPLQGLEAAVRPPRLEGYDHTKILFFHFHKNFTRR